MNGRAEPVRGARRRGAGGRGPPSCLGSLRGTAWGAPAGFLPSRLRIRPWATRCTLWCWAKTASVIPSETAPWKGSHRSPNIKPGPAAGRKHHTHHWALRRRGRWGWMNSIRCLTSHPENQLCPSRCPRTQQNSWQGLWISLLRATAGLETLAWRPSAGN